MTTTMLNSISNLYGGADLTCKNFATGSSEIPIPKSCTVEINAAIPICLNDDDFTNQKKYIKIWGATGSISKQWFVFQGSAAVYCTTSDYQNKKTASGSSLNGGSKSIVIDGMGEIVFTSASPWNRANNGIYYDDGNVGIGAASDDSYKLYVKGNVLGNRIYSNGLALQARGATLSLERALDYLGKFQSVLVESGDKGNLALASEETDPIDHLAVMTALVRVLQEHQEFIDNSKKNKQ